MQVLIDYSKQQINEAIRPFRLISFLTQHELFRGNIYHSSEDLLCVF